MSGSASLTEDEKASIRDYCGYPVYGDGAQSSDVRLFYTQYATLEFRMGNLTTSELTIARANMANLATAKAAIPDAISRLSTASAAVWTRNKNEPRDAQNLYAYLRRQMCDFIGIPPGPGLAARAGVSFVV